MRRSKDIRRKSFEGFRIGTPHQRLRRKMENDFWPSLLEDRLHQSRVPEVANEGRHSSGEFQRIKQIDLIMRRKRYARNVSAKVQKPGAKPSPLKSRVTGHEHTTPAINFGQIHAASRRSAAAIDYVQTRYLYDDAVEIITIASARQAYLQPTFAGQWSRCSRDIGTPLLSRFGLVVNPAVGLLHPDTQRNARRPAEPRLDQNIVA